MENVKRIKLALVSPSDVSSERSFVVSVTVALSDWISKHGFDLRLRRWEDVPPGFYPDGIQKYIDENLDIPNCDIVIGIFWKRYGVVDDPPYSRTAREILSALDASCAKGSPELLVYFSRQPMTEESEEDRAQSAAVEGFKKELQKRSVLIREFEPEQFGIAVLKHLLDYLDRITKQDYPRQSLICHAGCIPSLARAEGYAEPIGEIRLSVAGTVPAVSADEIVNFDLDLSVTTNVTSRIDKDGNSDAVLMSDRRGFLARGRLTFKNGLSNRIFFAAVPLGAKGSHIDEVLTISGVRTDAYFAGPGGRITALVEMAFANSGGSRAALLREQFTVATVVSGLVLSAECRSGEVIQSEGHAVRSFVVHFHCPFPGAFKTRDQEATGGMGYANQGTVLTVMMAGVPKEAETLVTLSDLQPQNAGSEPQPLGRAVAVRTNPLGMTIEQLNGPAPLFWEGRAPMVPAQRVNDSWVTAAWQIVSPMNDLRQLSFGISIVAPRSLPVPTLRLTAALSPFFSSAAARLPSVTLPVPRFSPGRGTEDVILRLA